MKKLITLALFLPYLAWGASHKENLSNKRLILEDSSCAGISFSKDGKNAYMYDERTCTKENAQDYKIFGC